MGIFPINKKFNDLRMSLTEVERLLSIEENITTDNEKFLCEMIDSLLVRMDALAEKNRDLKSRLADYE